jgi:hypothetical protein
LLSLVVECSILVELVVHGGIAHFLVVHGRKCNYPKMLLGRDKIQFFPSLFIVVTGLNLLAVVVCEPDTTKNRLYELNYTLVGLW